jgi:glyoxylase-like metal-dependent hydrolase (beta-lactamase superfamily II)
MPEVSVRRLGSTEVAVVHAGSIHARPKGFDGQAWQPGADVDEQGRAILGVNGMVIRTPDALVLVDPNSFASPEEIPSAELTVGPPLEAALDALTIDPADVTHVLVTHGHGDHFTGVLDDGELRFANAEHLYPRADLRDDPALQAAEAAGRLQLVDGDVEVADGITLLAAPGETAGHQVVRVESGGGRIYYLGDLVHVPCEVEHLDWCFSAGRDLDALEASRRRVFCDPGEGEATFVFSHGRFPGWGRVVPADDGWTWRYDECSTAPRSIRA